MLLLDLIVLVAIRSSAGSARPRVVSADFDDLHTRPWDHDVGIDGRTPLLGAHPNHPVGLEVLHRFDDDGEFPDEAIGACAGCDRVVLLLLGESLEHRQEDDRDHDERDQLDRYRHVEEREHRCRGRSHGEWQEEEARGEEFADGEHHCGANPDPSPLFSVHVCSFRCEDRHRRKGMPINPMVSPIDIALEPLLLLIRGACPHGVPVRRGPLFSEGCEVGPTTLSTVWPAATASLR